MIKLALFVAVILSLSPSALTAEEGWFSRSIKDTSRKIDFLKIYISKDYRRIGASEKIYSSTDFLKQIKEVRKSKIEYTLIYVEDDVPAGRLMKSLEMIKKVGFTHIQVNNLFEGKFVDLSPRPSDEEDLEEDLADPEK